MSNSIIHNVKAENNKFIGALILLDENSNIKNIMDEVKQNPKNKGIIIGLNTECSLNIGKLMKLLKAADENSMKVLINTYCTLEQFHGRIGIYYAKEYGKYDEIENSDYPRHDKDLAYISMGSQLLDYTVSDTYYIKCGTFANRNQKFYEIRKE